MRKLNRDAWKQRRLEVEQKIRELKKELHAPVTDWKKHASNAHYLSRLRWKAFALYCLRAELWNKLHCQKIANAWAGRVDPASYKQAYAAPGEFTRTKQEIVAFSPDNKGLWYDVVVDQGVITEVTKFIIDGFKKAQ